MGILGLFKKSFFGFLGIWWSCSDKGFSVLRRDGELKEQVLVMARAPVFKGTDSWASKSGEDPKNMEKPLVKIVMVMEMRQWVVTES